MTHSGPQAALRGSDRATATDSDSLALTRDWRPQAGGTSLTLAGSAGGGRYTTQADSESCTVTYDIIVCICDIIVCVYDII